MNKQFIFFFLFAIPLFCVAQNPLARMYDYDDSGNRTTCAVINLIPPKAPENQQDTTKGDFFAPLETEYFVEKTGNVEIKIYPNPTTEKITLEFSGVVETRYATSLRLYSLTGQLLQEQSVHSATTVVSLAGFAKGTYILKVQINGVTEDWKIIKQ
jgi:hypothetical protein